MRRIKNLAAIMLLAAVASLSAQTTFAGIIMTDRSSTSTPTITTDDLNSQDSTTPRAVGIIIIDFVTGIIMTD